MNVNIKRLSDEAVIPQYAHANDSGFDLIATEDVVIEPGATVKIPTGLAFQIPPGFELQIRPRSGITLKTKLRVQLGTVDSGFAGEVAVIVDNIGEKSLSYDAHCDVWNVRHNFRPLLLKGERAQITVDDWYYVQENTYLVRKGDRIAQGVIAPVASAVFTEVDSLGDSDRGANGFGSTGIKIEKGDE